jgi:DNA-binding NarL/FixJ family response regulator
MNKPISVLLVDDHALVRETLATWLRAAGDFEVVADVGSADEAVAEAIRHRPDVVVTDIDMPGLLVFDAIRTIKARSPRTRVLVLSAFWSDRYIEQALAVEAAGYVTKSEGPEVVARAIRLAAAGGTYFSPEVQSRIVVDSDGVRLGRPATTTRASTLTPRELEVLRYIAKGLSKRQIAEIMHLSVKTVDNHSTSLMHRLNIHDRVELTRYAIREGLAEP